MHNDDIVEIDPEVATFFKNVVTMAFATITDDYLDQTVLSKKRIGDESAEIRIYYDPKRGYKGFLYRLHIKDRAVWRKSFYTQQTHVAPTADNVLVRYDYSITTADNIVVDFVNEYRDERATKPLDNPPAQDTLP